MRFRHEVRRRPVSVMELGARGSRFANRPALMHYVEEREDLEASARELFDVVSWRQDRSAAGCVRFAYRGVGLDFCLLLRVP